MKEAHWGTMREAASYLGVSVKTVRRRITDGSIVAKRLGPRLVRVDMSRLEDSMRSLIWRGDQ